MGIASAKRILQSLIPFILLFSNPTNATTADLKDTARLEAFVDGIVMTSLNEFHIAGAVVAVMVDGDIVISNGYGYADVAKKRSVNPDKTMFRIGSVTKLFTYMALMQLHEQGKLDLQADIQVYLPNLEIPKTYAEPIRVINLFTHTAGFEDRIIGLYGKGAASAKPYAELLSEDLPARVRKPGLVSSYSNHSLGIAGLIIENVSGLSWDQYIQENILDPLEMQYATASQPVPAMLEEHRAIGYRWVNGAYQAQDFEYIPLGAAGTMSASASAMMRFMSATLQGGVLDGNRVISESTLKQMQSRLYEVHPLLDAWLYGYFENSGNDVYSFGHTGKTSYFSTLFMMLPDDKTGLFVSTNSTGGRKLMGAVQQGLLDRYYPFESRIEPLSPPSDSGRIAGEYATYRHAVTTLGKLNRLNATLRVVPAKPGQINLIGSPQGQQTATEIAPMVFQIKDKNTKIFFDQDEYGQQRMFVGGAARSFYKLGLLDSGSFHMALLVPGLVLMLWALIAWPIQRFKSSRQPSVAEHRSRLAFWWFSAFSLVTTTGIILNSSEPIVFGMTEGLRVFLNLAYIVPILAIVVVFSLTRLVSDPGTEKRIKALHTSMALTAIAISWLLNYWNLFGA